MEGLVEESASLIEEEADPEVLDAGIICGSQKIEHYEIAGYGTARTFAELLGEEEARELLEKTLEEEKATDEKLTGLATSSVNLDAASTDGGDEGEKPAAKSTRAGSKPGARRKNP
jgi:ferritin-like metal-binding protein YciE